MSTKTPEEVLKAWAESAAYWEKHRDSIRAMFGPITAALIGEANTQPGESVLDVAGGAGEPSLTIAEEPVGVVVCTDAAYGMVSAARREALKLHLHNIEFGACLAESLPFGDNSFDAVVSRLRVMF